MRRLDRAYVDDTQSSAQLRVSFSFAEGMEFARECHLKVARVEESVAMRTKRILLH